MPGYKYQIVVYLDTEDDRERIEKFQRLVDQKGDKHAAQRFLLDSYKEGK